RTNAGWQPESSGSGNETCRKDVCAALHRSVAFIHRVSMRLGFCLAILVLTTSFASAQTSADWQQRVRYEMETTLHPERHQFDGRQRLTYYNHSPDTLREVFYHLYFNAFQPTSMMAERNRHLPDPAGRVVP